MKIIESVPNLNSGGGEKLVVDLSAAFYELGHECKILTLFAPAEGNILASQVNPQIRKDHLDKHLGFDIKCLFRFLRYVKKEKPDVVHICTPHYLHAPMAIALLDAGKRVLTEKPIASEVKDADMFSHQSAGDEGYEKL